MGFTSSFLKMWIEFYARKWKNNSSERNGLRCLLHYEVRNRKRYLKKIDEIDFYRLFCKSSFSEKRKLCSTGFQLTNPVLRVEYANQDSREACLWWWCGRLYSLETINVVRESFPKQNNIYLLPILVYSLRDIL